MSNHSKKMPETMYRASRYFRVLGNPTAYRIIRSLAEEAKSPTSLAAEQGLSIGTISVTLRNLRQINLVRYETRGHGKLYRLKEQRISGVLKKAEEFAEIMRKIKD